jgi:hypothetical protein
MASNKRFERSRAGEEGDMEGQNDVRECMNGYTSDPSSNSSYSMHEAPSQLLVEQRVRNRIFEYLQGVTEYHRSPGAWDLNQLINEWETWVDHPFLPADFPPPAFSADEVAALAITHVAWLAFADSTAKDIKDDREPLSLPEWKTFVDACSDAIRVFRVRGRLREDAEIGQDA